MTCREFVEFLDAYLRDALAPAEREEFERHLVVCDACINYMASYSDTIRLGRSAFANDGIPDEVPEELVHAILAARR